LSIDHLPYIGLGKNPYRRWGEKPRMGFFLLEKGPTGPLYGFLPSANIEQVVYSRFTKVVEE
jgi:hypothetical protein